MFVSAVFVPTILQPVRWLRSWLECPPLPRRVTYAMCAKLWEDGLFRGATIASIAWIALILFALIVVVLVRKFQR